MYVSEATSLCRQRGTHHLELLFVTFCCRGCGRLNDVKRGCQRLMRILQARHKKDVNGFP